MHTKETNNTSLNLMNTNISDSRERYTSSCREKYKRIRSEHKMLCSLLQLKMNIELLIAGKKNQWYS